MKTFPIQSKLGTNQAVPYDLVLKCEKRLMRNHGGQSVERLAQRGGLCWSELVCGLLDIGLFEEKAEQMHQDEKLAFAEYNNWRAKNAVRERIANPVEALRAVLALFPADVSDDGSGRVGFTPEFIRQVEDARAMLAEFDKAPAQLVWLNLGDGSFSEAFSASDSQFAEPNKLVDMSDSIASPLWKLIEFRCLNDVEFAFDKNMRLR